VNTPGRRGVVPALAALIALLLVAGVAGAVVQRPAPSPGPAAAPSPASGGSATTAPSGQPSAGGNAGTGRASPTGIEAFIPEAERFVEAHRGLTFKKPVQVSLLRDGDFRRRLQGQQGDEDKAAVERETRVLRGLGLLEGSPDVAKAENALLGDTVVGFYDVKEKALVVRGAQPSPFVRQVLVHELTHALQDQWFGIDRPEVDRSDDERSNGFLGLVEGDARRIDAEYRASLPAQEQGQAELEELSQGGDAADTEIPPVLADLLGFPYVVGPPFVKAVLAARGQPGLDAAFAAPPTTTEQLLHPDRYLAGDAAKPVEDPPAEGKVIDRGVLGEQGLTLVLQLAVSAGAVGPADARQAALGWGGDRYVAWDSGKQTCVRTRMVMDTGNDTRELLDALRRFAARTSGLDVQGSGPVTFTRCG
jgi:hypothetical protein